ncbi:hypothetical protein DFH11DRAFT_1840633 [Phellopilus nigrolimitatus]|nr:hypothetical protein DFH11DRAFT_1840633 [Phellopilus nigrolimitatus]
MAGLLRRRSLTRVFWIIALAVLAHLLFFSSATPECSDKLDVQKYDFLRVALDGTSGQTFSAVPYVMATSSLDKATSHLDQQIVLAGIEQLLTLNGWVAALCPNLSRPFGQSDNAHSADHFLVDQLDVIVRMARQIGTQYIFVFMLDYDPLDSTETLLDLCEAVLTLIGTRPQHTIPSRRRTRATSSSSRSTSSTRSAKSSSTAPSGSRASRALNDIFEMIMASQANDARRDGHNGFFIFSDCWRTRDINGDLKNSGSPSHEPQTTDTALCLDSAQAYFCRDLWLSAACEGVRAVEDPMEDAVAAGVDARRRHARRAEEAAEEGEEANRAEEDEQEKRAEEGVRGRHVDGGGARGAPAAAGDSDANVDSEFDAVPETGEGKADDDAAGEDNALADVFSILNGILHLAQILVNPRCVTTYAGVSHAQLVLGLFGPEKGEEDGPGSREKYVLDDWKGAPKSFVCQKQRYVYRKAPKKQRRLSFSVHDHSESEAEDGS